MYNGIGLLTPRGSGTSGHVQNNKFNLRSAPPLRAQPGGNISDMEGPKQVQPDKSILEHKSKREIELAVAQEQAKLEDEGLPEADIEEAIKVYREMVTEKFKTSRCACVCMHACIHPRSMTLSNFPSLSPLIIQSQHSLPLRAAEPQGKVTGGDTHEVAQRKVRCSAAHSSLFFNICQHLWLRVLYHPQRLHMPKLQHAKQLVPKPPYTCHAAAGHTACAVS
eukprot:1149321-Pelagomonas_calceolata.AAC.5